MHLVNDPIQVWPGQLCRSYGIWCQPLQHTT
jgi:hypothetical protein